VPRYVAAGFAAVAACSSSSVPYDDWATERQNALCKRDVRCGLFESQAACLAYFRVLPDPSLAKAIADHKVSYDSEAAFECISALAKLSCDTTSKDFRVVPTCDDVFNGVVAGGDECGIAAECKTGSCMLGSGCSADTCCAGACTAGPPSAIGGPCHVDADCAPSLYCSALDQTCHALGQDGDTCYIDSECDYGLGCVTTTSPGVCHALGASGGACPYGRCANDGETCQGSTMTCVPVGLPGGPCMTAADCSPYGACNTAAEMCSDAPDIGQTCTGNCEADARCDLVASGQCEALTMDGNACDTDRDCASGYCLEGPAFDSCAEPLACD